MYDLIIIGAGVSGCCIAREISRYKIKACVIEKGDDVASGTSKANTGVIHTGLEAPPGSLMSELCVRGNELMYEWAKDLNFPAEKNGKRTKPYRSDSCRIMGTNWRNCLPI